MNKYILISLFLFLFIGDVYSDFNVVGKSYEFKPTTELRSFYSQQNGDDPSKGYHKAEVYFKTKVPSVNPDQNGVTSIDCSDGNKITLGLNDKKAIEKVKDWPDKVMLLISHKWECFGEKSTQTFMIKSKSIDTSNKKVTFITESCKVSDWSKDFIIDLSWVNGLSNNRNNRRKLNTKALIPIPKTDLSNKLSLNVLFNETTGKSSSPNFPLLQDENLSLLCENCFLKGDATISMTLAGSFGFSLDLTEASISLNGSALMNIDLSLNGTAGAGIGFDKILLSIPLPGNFNVPKLFSLGPSVDLVASTNITTNVTGSLGFGGDISLPNFNANFTFIDVKNPKFTQSGFKPKTKLHKPKFGIDSASADVAGSIKPQLALGLNILNGVFEQKLGFQVVGTLNNNISFGGKGKNSCLKKTQPRLKIDLNGNLGFFINDDNFPVVDFPSLNLLNKCL
ncbi:hypothetical protein RhiirA5_418610 [Rhizophagus irregularis]|uniref:DUF7029 domain-containing protein n=2 Tax=Rhizophagus irregularis TaxID=588596 RepID=A0A2N0PJY3_9GLOM|nr:hypothetical protein RhiirA5_418610 [Rhizophagus irregularis]PKC57931.1 hypothetical protein RhiirA1_471727 [Rhizophagus irregularis]CAB4482298.1 unnamed protein product [Rhizophagus irregularis]CAB5190389.1 unnamed protein product [Rhizophagus irregularis]